jgi:hypothetical protein
LLDETDGYARVNLQGEWHLSDDVTVFARI